MYRMAWSRSLFHEIKHVGLQRAKLQIVFVNTIHVHQQCYTQGRISMHYANDSCVRILTLIFQQE